MKNVTVTFELKVKDDATVEQVMDDIIIDQYNVIEEVVSSSAEEIENEDPADLCLM